MDPVVPSLTVLELEGGSYQETAAVRGEEPLEATTPLPVTVVPAALTR